MPQPLKVQVLVVGAGIAGCAAAVAAAEAGASVLLCEAGAELGGVAAAVGHRWICGLAPIDSPQATLLEPDFVEPWLRALDSTAPQRRGRVWLWPTSGLRWRRALLQRLAAAGVDLRLRAGLVAAQAQADGWHCRLDAQQGPVDLRAARLIDASGGPALARLLGLSTRAAGQWGALRMDLRLPASHVATAAARLRLLRTLGRQLGPCHAAFEALDEANHWQLTLDVDPALDADHARELGRLAARMIDAELLTEPLLADRDQGAAAGDLDLDELFATRSRGLCWAAWPMELHGSTGITWRWPPEDRHGVPERAATPPGAGPGLWSVGTAAPLASAAAAALRVTGTQLALGSAVGRLAAG